MNIPPFAGRYRDDNQNQIHFHGDLRSFPKSLELSGWHNQMEVGEGTDLRGLDIVIGGDGNLLYIGEGCILGGEINISGHNQTVQIGNRTTFARVFLYADESTNIRIGEDCMFATGIDIRASDSHELRGLAGWQRVNPPGSVTIGHHVRIDRDVAVIKGVSISSNSIISARAFVNQSFEQEGVMIAGSPGRIVRENVHWERPRLALE